MEPLCFWVVGGDRRQRMLAELLVRDGHAVHVFALGEEDVPGVLSEKSPERIGKADCVIFPLPVSREKGGLFAPLSGEKIDLERILETMVPGQLAVGGQIGEEVIRAFQSRSLRWRDYFEREELTVANAVPTAEGGLQVAMEQLPITIHGARALILGYGRIGRTLASRLRGLGAVVTAAARRREQLAWAQAEGCAVRPLEELREGLGEYDVIFNTAPALLLTEEYLQQLKPGCAVIDLASEPGGAGV